MIKFEFFIDKFYACGTYGLSTINTYQTQSIVMKLDNKMKVEKFKFIRNDFNGITDNEECYCDIYNDKLIAFLLTNTSQTIFIEIDIPNMSTIQGYHRNTAWAGEIMNVSQNLNKMYVEFLI